MPLYQVTKDKLESVPTTSFTEEKLFERKDLQRLLVADIAPLGSDLMIVAEEFGDWEEGKRRIDLLCLDKQANLVVVELKRTEDGGYMDLQAVRYAAMVSSMTLEQAISAHAKFIGGVNPIDSAQKAILDFLEYDAIEDAELTGEVRILLVSGNFSSELTTSVIWLNKHDLDITCVKFKPYKSGTDLLIDVTQIIPLPESADYEIKVREQAKETKKVRTARQEILRRFWSQLIDKSKPQTQLLVNRSTTVDHWISAGIGTAGFHLSLSLTEDRARVECYMRIGKGNDTRSKEAFKALLVRKEEIEKAFGDPLDWQELPARSGCRICKTLDGGWQAAEAEWPALQQQMIETLIRLEKALKVPIQELKGWLNQ